MNRKTWSFKKHFILCTIGFFIPVIIGVVIFIIGLINPGINASSSIGIIGGADGPTVVFVSSSLSDYKYFLIIWVVAYVVLLSLYKPIKSIIEKKNKEG